MERQEKPSCHGMETSAALAGTRRALPPFPFAFPASLRKGVAKKKFCKGLEGCGAQYLV
jgi:hypothetical protein